MSNNNKNDPSSLPQDHNHNGGGDDLSSNISIDASSAAFTNSDLSIGATTSASASVLASKQNDHNDDDDDGIVMHSMPHPEEIPRALKKKNNKAMQTFAGVAGNVLEWYDFAVFGFFSDIIGKVFFPPQEGDADIVESFTVFGLAFLMRPIGGALLGYIGDTYGRKRALEISIFLMAFPTFMMGCLPSYERVGPLAIVLLILVRCLQGLSVGGQLMSSLVFTLEQNPRHQWGLFGSYVMAAANFGTLLGGLIASTLRATMTEEQLLSYGWRIPFLSGILVSLCGFYLKFYGDEDTIDHHHGGGDASTPAGNPIKMAFRKENLGSLIAASLVPMLWSGGFYISFVWMATFTGELMIPPVPGAFIINSAALFVSVCILFPLAGILSDIFGRVKVMFLGGAMLAIFHPVMLYVISQGNPAATFFAQSAIGIMLSLWGAPMMAWLVETFPPNIRLTSVAVGYNIAQAVAGGASPALATYFVEKEKFLAPGFMVSGIATFAVIGLGLGVVMNNNIDSSSESSSRERSPSQDGLFNYDSDSSLDKKADGEKVSEMELI